MLDERRSRLEGLARGLGDPQRLLDEKRQRLEDWGDRLHIGLKNWVHRRESQVLESSSRLKAYRSSILRLIERDRVNVDEVGARAQRCAHAYVDRLRRKLETPAGMLRSLSYERILDRGFVLVTDKRGHPLTAAADTHASMALTLQFKDGAVGAVVTESTGEKRPKPAAAPAPTKQGSLL
jgi:exodeoxyribonuclease VII large subunit